MRSSRHPRTSREEPQATLIIPKEGIRYDVLKYRLRNWFGPDATVELARSPTTGEEAYVIRNVTEKGRRTELAIIEDLKDESAKADEAERTARLRPLRPSDTPSSRQQPTRPSIPSARGQGYAAQPPVQYTYIEKEVAVPGPPNTLFPKETFDVPRSGGYPVRKSSLKNLPARHESNTPSNTSQPYVQKSEGVDVQDIRRRPTRGLKTDREWVEPDDEEEEGEEEEFADSQQAPDRRRAHAAGANVAIPRRSDAGAGRSRIPVPALETMKERSLRSPDDPRSWYDEPGRNIRLSQETLPKVAPITILPHRTIPEGRSKYSSQQQGGYGDLDRYGAEGCLSLSFNRKREDEGPDPDPDPDPDQPSSGGTIGFSQRYPTSRSLLENTLGTSTRRRPGRHSPDPDPDPDPDQPDYPYGFSTDDAQAQDSQLRPDVRLRGDSRSRATPPETERSSVSRPAGQYHTNQRDFPIPSKDRRSERPPEPSRRHTSYYTSSGTRKDDKDIYDRHRR